MSNRPEAKPPTLWVDRPLTDLLIGCGGWSAPLLLLSYLLVESDARRWSALFYGLALVCNYPHYMATIVRAYGRRDDRAQHRLFTHYVTGLLVLLAVAAHVQVALLAWLFTAYVLWSPWHYTGQNFGLSMMFLRRAGLDVAAQERQRLYVAFIASYVMLLASMNTGVSRDPFTLSLGLPARVSLAVQICAGLVFLASGVSAFWSLRRKLGAPGAGDAAAAATRGAGARIALAAPVTLYCTQALWFVVPIALTWVTSTHAPQTRYSTGILAVMHSAQYLWITQHFARRDAARGPAATAPGTDAGMGWTAWRYWTLLIVGGVALFIPGPWLASYAGAFDFTASMLIVTAVVNLHHFVLDGVVWKLRDKRVSQVLVEATPHSNPLPARRGEGRGPRGWWKPALRGAVAVLLVALAAVDQWRYRLALVGDADPQALQQASALNPYDTRVQMRLATSARREGDEAAVERALRRAIEVQAGDPAAWHALERFLIESNRWTDAYAHCRALLERWPHEVDTLVNAGVLAHRLGDPAAAENWWRRALDRDPTLAHVHLYQAELLDAAGRPKEAIAHYQRHLELLVARREPQRQPPPRQIALVVMKLADALARTGQPDLAKAQYALAARIARQTGLADIEAAAAQGHSPTATLGR